jgi:hypothetical protein
MVSPSARNVANHFGSDRRAAIASLLKGILHNIGVLIVGFALLSSAWELMRFWAYAALLPAL